MICHMVSIVGYVGKICIFVSKNAYLQTCIIALVLMWTSCRQNSLAVGDFKRIDAYLWRLTHSIRNVSLCFLTTEPTQVPSKFCFYCLPCAIALHFVSFQLGEHSYNLIHHRHIFKIICLVSSCKYGVTDMLQMLTKMLLFEIYSCLRKVLND